MEVEVFSGNPFPSFSGLTRDSVLNAPSSFHYEAFPAQITNPASTLRSRSAKKARDPKYRIQKRRSRSASNHSLHKSTPTMSDSEQDKKRNKLGYQRISIACAHCRRRKIRCLLADKDPQGRCQNCIRLKKECIFYPIDQQSAYESRSDQGSRRGVGSASSSGVSSTSPDLQSSHGHGVGRTQFPPMPQTTQGFQSMPIEPGALFQGQYFPVDRPYPESLPSNSPWPPPVSRGFDMHAQTRRASPAHAQRYWAYEQSPGSVDFSPFPNESAQKVRTPSTTFTASFPQSSPEQQWQSQQPQLARSMTYPLPAASIGSNLPEYASSYATDTSQHLPPASYPSFSTPLESPHTMRQVQGPPFSTPIPQTQSFSEHGGSYEYRGPHEHQHGAIPVQQEYPVNWYPSSAGLGVSVEEQHSIPSNAPPPYVVPSQRPR